LPRHLVKVRDGNDESVQYFHSEEELAEFGSANADLKLFGAETDTTLLEKADKLFAAKYDLLTKLAAMEPCIGTPAVAAAVAAAAPKA